MTLTVALAILAGLVLAALVAHGAWSARRAHPRQPVGVAPTPRVEPALGESPVAADGDMPYPAPPTTSPRPAARLDALVDATVPMALEQPVSGEAVLSHRPASQRAGTKPFLIEGLNAQTGEWEPPAAGQRYSELQAGVQLANRSGPLNEIEYSEFVHKLQAFADSVGALPDFPDMLDVVARGRELDGFAGPLDAQLTVRLLARSVAWSVGYVQQSALRQGLVSSGAVSGRMLMPSTEEGAPPLLVLAFDANAALAAMADDPQAAALREVTLSLDVPQTPESMEPFPVWHRVAHALAEDMDADLVDDAGRPITLHAFDAIGKELAQLYEALQSHDLAAGSPAARRLFSG